MQAVDETGWVARVRVAALQQLRALPAYRQTPIIAIAANAYDEDKARCVDAGMSDYLIKPYDPEALFAIVLKALSGMAPQVP